MQQQGKQVEQKDKKETNKLNCRLGKQNEKKEAPRPVPAKTDMMMTRMKTGANGLDILERLEFNQNDIEVVSQAIQE